MKFFCHNIIGNNPLFSITRKATVNNTNVHINYVSFTLSSKRTLESTHTHTLKTPPPLSKNSYKQLDQSQNLIQQYRPDTPEEI